MNTDFSDDDLLALSGIQHFAFCERQWALIHVEKQWAENVKTAEGRVIHDRTHDADIKETYDDSIITRSMFLTSKKLGIFGQADVVEFWLVTKETGGVELPGHSGYWMPNPVEYKRGKPKPDDRDEVQLCAQALCIEEMLNVHIKHGCMYYGEIRRRTQVAFDETIRDHVKNLCYRMHEILNQGITPKAVYCQKCDQCSLFSICLPKLASKKALVEKYLFKVINEDISTIIEDVK